MRRLLTCALLGALLWGCTVEAPAYRPTPTPLPTAKPTVRPDVLGLTFRVDPLDVPTGKAAVKKTALFFSNPNAFALDWFMTVRFKSADGLTVTDGRIGNADVPPNRADPKFQNWYFPIPPGDSWTIVRSDWSFTKSDVQELKIARSIAAIGEVPGVEVARQACANDPEIGVIGCTLTVATTTTLPKFSKLHLVVILRSVAPRVVVGALQWRPEFLPTGDTPWFNLAAGDSLKVQMYDGYPTPTVPWEYEVFAHVYQFPGQ
jgi:hypothetical protein